MNFEGIDSDELKKVSSSLPQLKKEMELITNGPDKFNSHFSKLGWIAHESINHDLMVHCINLADNGQIDIAEKELINHYSSEKIKWLIDSLIGIPAFRPRLELINKAYEDTIALRYHGAVPIILMMIDGAVNDIDKETGFFADKTNITAWDSIAAHNTGLPELRKVFNSGRNKTNGDQINLPYRNGILHGRDLGYDNQIVAAKCWAALFSIADWARAVIKGKKAQPVGEKEKTVEETIDELQNTIEKHKQNQLIKERLNNWHPRNIIIGQDIPDSASSEKYLFYSPEREAVLFMENWRDQNYGAIVTQIHKYSRREDSDKKEAGGIRKIFLNKQLIQFKIVKIEDKAPAISEITLLANLLLKGKNHSMEITLRFIYEGLNGELLINGDPNGQWKFIENFFNKLELLQ